MCGWWVPLVSNVLYRLVCFSAKKLARQIDRLGGLFAMHTSLAPLLCVRAAAVYSHMHAAAGSVVNRPAPLPLLPPPPFLPSTQRPAGPCGQFSNPPINCAAMPFSLQVVIGYFKVACVAAGANVVAGILVCVRSAHDDLRRGCATLLRAQGLRISRWIILR